jgi:hypothetical protein
MTSAALALTEIWLVGKTHLVLMREAQPGLIWVQLKLMKDFLKLK